MAQHMGARVFLIILMCVVFIVTATLAFLANRPGTLIFPNTTSTISAQYNTEVTPANFTFRGIWIAIYSYLGLFIIYSCTTLLRASGPGYLYTHPEYLPPTVYVSFIVSQVATVIWLFLWTYEQLIAALFFVLISATCAYVSLAVASHGVFTKQKALVSYGHPHEYRFVLGLVINPLGLYAMWLTIATLINLSVVLVYRVEVTQNAGGSISLAVLTGLVVCYALVDLAFFERYFRYLYTPILCLIWAFIGILIGNLDWDTSNTIFTLGLTIVSIAIFLLKVALSLYRAVRKPLFKTSKSLGYLPPNMPYIPPQEASVSVVKTSDAPLPSWPSLS